MATKMLIIVTIINILMCCRTVECIDVHIKSSSNDQCLGSPCFTLSQFLFRIRYLNATDTTLIFEAGNHSLESELLIAGITSFSMITNATSFSDHNVVIVCNGPGKFTFINAYKVHVNGLNFVGCIGNRIQLVDQFIVEDSNFIGKKRTQSTHSSHSDGSIVTISQYTSAIFVRTSFKQNEYGTTRHSPYISYDPQYGTFNYKVHIIDLGGAIYASKSKIEFVECLFEGNKAGFGGAIYIVEKSEIMVINSSFIKNLAYYHYQGITEQINKVLIGYGGGAIHANDSSLFIDNCSFINNTAKQNGGAVIWTSHGGNISIVGSAFTDNKARNGGGAMWWDSANTVISIRNCSFVNNTAVERGNGGALKLNTAFNMSTTISGNLFSNNSAHNKSGGVISISGTNKAPIIMSYNKFISNHASNTGGVVSFLKNKYVYGFTDVIMIENLFTDNTAVEDGGVFEFENANIKVTRSNFTGNRADGNGGIFFILHSNLIIVESLFQFNIASKDGGVIASESSDISISDSDFTGNSVKKGGHAGVVKAHDTSLSIIDTLLTNNKADFGGVLWAKLAVVQIHNVIVFGNLANTDGGVCHKEQTEMVITGTNFVSNRADNNGGIMLADRDRISMVDCKFHRSTAGNDGGVIRSYLSEVNVSDSTFLSNRAGNDGGVCYSEQSNLTISDQTLFTDNRAVTGGVIWNDAGILDIDQSFFTNNTANIGGVVWTDAGTANINQATFTSNRANTAAVVWMDRASVFGNMVNVTDNHANYTIIYSLESTIEFKHISLSTNIGSLSAIESTVRLTDAVMTNMKTVSQSSMNQLEEGGAITAFQSEIILAGTTSLMHNRARKGGAIHATEAKLHIHGTVTVANNTALQSGGGVYLYQSELSCQRKNSLKLLGNIAMEKGGGIHAVGSLMKVKAPVVKSLEYSMLNFVTNQADKGGGIFLEMDSKIYILKSRANNFTEKHKIIKFTANEANYGGAVYVSDDGMCALSASNKECFFQTLALYGNASLFNFEYNTSRCMNMYFEKNRARISGHSLYGGLLDRCKSWDAT